MLLPGRFLTFLVWDDAEYVEHVQKLRGFFEGHDFADVVDSTLFDRASTFLEVVLRLQKYLNRAIDILFQFLIG